MLAAKALFTYAVLGLVVLAWIPTMALLRLVTAPFDRTRRIPGRFFRLCAIVIAAACPVWRMRVFGRIRKLERAYLVVSNHESNLDPFLLSHFPWEMKWIAKQSLFKAPGVGLLMKMAGDIPLLRGDKDSGAKALDRARWYLEHGMSVMVFPEGTRSHGDELLPFRAGAFRLAIETGCPILPIALNGTGAAMPKGSPWIQPAAPLAKALEPISVDGLSADDAERLAERVRLLIQTERDSLRRNAQSPAELTVVVNGGS